MSAQVIPFRPRAPKPEVAPSPFSGPPVPVPGGYAYPLDLVLEMFNPENLLLLRRVQAAFPRPFPPTGSGPRAA